MALSRGQEHSGTPGQAGPCRVILPFFPGLHALLSIYAENRPEKDQGISIFCFICADP